MRFEMTRKQVKKLSLLWLGLVVLNVFLSMSPVEDFFKDDPSLITRSEICESGKYYTQKNDKEGTALFAFLGSATSVQSDSENEDIGFSSSSFKYIIIVQNLVLNSNQSFIKSKQLSANSPRAPPEA